MNKKNKVIAGIVGLAVFSAMMYAMKPNKDLPQPAPIEEAISEEPIEPPQTITEEEPEEATQKEPVIDEDNLEGEVEEIKNGFEKMQQCQKDVNKEFVGMEQEVEQLASSFYINQNEFTGHGTYSTMPLESLKALAESNDSEAMAVYGMEMVWRGSRGISIFDMNQNSIVSRTERREQRREHKFDAAQVQEGADSLYQAAVHGRTGALMMLSQSYNMQLRALYNTEASSSEFEQLMAQQMASQSLFRFTLQKDEAIISNIPDQSDRAKERYKNMMQRSKELRMSDEEFEKSWENVEKKTAELEKEYEEQWVTDREYWGYEHFTDYFNEDQESYLIALNHCTDELKEQATQRRQERQKKQAERRKQRIERRQNNNI